MPILNSLASIISDVTPGLTLRINTGASPILFIHFLILDLGFSPAVLNSHNLGRIPKIFLFGAGRTPALATVLICFIFIFSVDYNLMSAPV